METTETELLYLLSASINGYRQEKLSNSQWGILETWLDRFGDQTLNKFASNSLKTSYFYPSDVGEIWLWNRLPASSFINLTEDHHRSSDNHENLLRLSDSVFSTTCQKAKEFLQLSGSMKENGGSSGFHHVIKKRQQHVIKQPLYFLETARKRSASTEGFVDLKEDQLKSLLLYLKELKSSEFKERSVIRAMTAAPNYSSEFIFHHWVLDLLPMIKEHDPEGALHKDVSEYVATHLVPSMQFKDEMEPDLKKVIKLKTFFLNTSDEILSKTKINYRMQTKSRSWQIFAMALKQSGRPVEEYNHLLPKEDDFKQLSSFAMRNLSYSYSEPLCVITYPFDDDPQGAEKAAIVMPLIQKYLFYSILTTHQNSIRRPTINLIVEAVKNSKILSSLMKEDCVSSVQWGLWSEFGANYVPKALDNETLADLFTSDEYKDAVNTLPPLLKGTVLNIQNARQNLPVTEKMLRLSVPRDLPTSEGFSYWNSLFTKHSMQKELSKKKSRLKEKPAPIKRRM